MKIVIDKFAKEFLKQLKEPKPKKPADKRLDLDTLKDDLRMKDRFDRF